MDHLLTAAAAGFAVSVIATFVLGLLLVFVSTKRFRLSGVLKGMRIPATELKWLIIGAVTAMLLGGAAAGYGVTGLRIGGVLAGLAGAAPLAAAGLRDLIFPQAVVEDEIALTAENKLNRKARRAASSSANA
jgi:hypothetical protein